MVTLLIVAALGFLIEMLVMKGLGYFGNPENQHIADLLDATIVALLVGPIAAAVVLVRHPRKDIDSTQLLSGRAGKGLAILVFVIGMAAASGAAMIASRQIASADETRFHRLSERLAGEVSRRFQLFEYGLQGARGLWRASKSVERGEFADWVRSRDLKREFFGAMGMGFIRKVPVGEIEQFLARTRGDGEPGFSIRPAEIPAPLDRYVIEFIEPLATNQEAMGYDIGSEENRRRAADEAAATGRPTMTAPITLVQAIGDGPGFLFLHAVYRNNTPIGTTEQRIAATEGWVYFPILFKSVLEGTADTVDGELDFEIFYGSSRDIATMLYDDDKHLAGTERVVAKRDYHDRKFSRFDTVTVGQRPLTLVTSTTDKFVAGSVAPVWGILCGGALLSALAGGLIYVISGTAQRATALAAAKTKEIERAAAALARNEAALRFTSRLASVGWWEFEVADKRVIWSEQTRRIHRVSDEFQPSLESAINFYAPEARSRISAALQNAIDHHKPFNLELPMFAADGTKLWVLAQGEPIIRDGVVVSVFGAFQDVTEQVVSRQKAEDASRSKSEFLANMSHEIRTPMTAILGFTDLLAEDGDIAQAPERRRDAIHTIRRNGQHLLTLINDILDVSKIEAGKMTVEHIPTEIHKIVEDVLSLMRVRTQAKGIGLSVVYGTEIPRSFRSDPVRIKQILVNLIGNAIKFTERGNVTIRVSFDPVGPHGGTLVLAVQDTGVGMTEAQLARIFRPFSQADETMTRTFGGTGLGLTIARRLAQLLGGEISVQSTHGKGSTFTVTLATGHIPVGETWNPTGATVSAVPQVARPEELPSLSGVRVLLAEDGIDNQRLISFFLTRAGAALTVVDNGKKAIEALSMAIADGTRLIEPAPFDLVLMDMQMPEIDGYSATRRLRTMGCTLPIVALTAHAMAGDRQVCLDAGCDDYTTKPIDRVALITMCARWANAQPRSAGAATGGTFRR
jgi:signal transduction histidine kinase/CHASE1-domain containing sensor protein/ActR/RegA family two-component response regulator